MAAIKSGFGIHPLDNEVWFGTSSVLGWFVLQMLTMICGCLHMLVKDLLQKQDLKLLEQDRENQRRQEIKDREVWETQQMRLHDRWHETYYAGCVWRVRR